MAIKTDKRTKACLNFIKKMDSLDINLIEFIATYATEKKNQTVFDLEIESTSENYPMYSVGNPMFPVMYMRDPNTYTVIKFRS